MAQAECALMSGIAAPIDVLRSALVHLGHKPVATLNDQTPNAVAFNTLYESMVRAELVKPAWRFATKTASLVYQGETDIGPQYQYAMPSDVLKPRYLELNRLPFRDYEIMGKKVLVEAKGEYVLVYVARVAEGDWPPDFADAMTKLMASRLPFGSAARKAELAAEAQMELNDAAGRDANNGRGEPTRVDSRLVRAWMNRPGRRDRYGRTA
jgi:hypothetical protein